MRLTVNRPEGQKEVTVNLGTLPSQDKNEDGQPDLRGGARSPLEGVSVDELDRATAQQLQLPPTVRGVVVTEVDPASDAYEAGLRRGDVIQQVNRRDVTTVRDFEAAVRNSTKSVLLLVNTRGATRFIVIEPSTR